MTDYGSVPKVCPYEQPSNGYACGQAEIAHPYVNPITGIHMQADIRLGGD